MVPCALGDLASGVEALRENMTTSTDVLAAWLEARRRANAGGVRE